MNIAENINVILKKQNLQQKELANYLGIAPSTLNGWLKLGRSIPSEYLIRISEFLKVSTDYLLGKTNEPNKISGNQIKTGDINGDMNMDTNKTSQYDKTTNQVAEAFSNLDFLDKAKVMNLIAELSEKRGA